MQARTGSARQAAALLLAIAVLQPQGRAARAAETSRDDEAQMQDGMHRYFTGERRGGIWLMGVGAPAIALGTGLLFHPDPFPRGLAYSVLAFGAVELLGGAMFYLNSQRRVPRFERQIGGDPRAYHDTELARMRRVNREMRLLEAVEIGLILAGGAMTCVGALQREDLLAGIGTGLMLQAGVLLIYDQLAARRALAYTGRLTRFGVGLAPGPGAAPGGAVVSVLRPF